MFDSDPEANDEVFEASDEHKQQELDLNSITGLETELLMMNISDREKLELKQSTNNDSTNSLTNFDKNNQIIKRIIALSLETISDNRREILPNFDLLNNLLINFTSIESLSGNNKYFCENCTKTNGSEQKQLTNASKRALIALPPPVLTLHLKRFEAEGNRRSINLKKISTFVSFPATFDLSPFVSKIYNYLTPITGHQKTNAIIYQLYGVVEHTGSLRSGHYTAYVKHRPMNENLNKFSILEPFMPKIENILKIIEQNFFNGSEEEIKSSANGLSNGFHQTNGDSTTDGLNTAGADDECVGDCGKWFHISDTSVTSSSLSSVLRSQAYILFYERIA